MWKIDGKKEMIQEDDCIGHCEKKVIISMCLIMSF